MLIPLIIKSTALLLSLIGARVHSLTSMWSRVVFFFSNLPSALISLTRPVKRAQRDAHLAEHPPQRNFTVDTVPWGPPPPFPNPPQMLAGQ